MSKQKYYVVLQGRKTGIFSTWEECKQQVDGYSKARYKSFKTLEDAESFLDQGFFTELSQNQTSSHSSLASAVEPKSPILYDSICVDASCIGNPGDVEYRGVDTKNGKQLFHVGPLTHGTNNVGEFLAIVHGVAYLQKQNKNIPIYSDSETAILWVKNKKIRTTLKRDSSNEEIFKLVDRALIWLENNEYNIPILKWNTASWGEIPADFGRK